MLTGWYALSTGLRPAAAETARDWRLGHGVLFLVLLQMNSRPKKRTQDCRKAQSVPGTKLLLVCLGDCIGREDSSLMLNKNDWAIDRQDPRGDHLGLERSSEIVH
jgi:hypothetical protein